VRSARYAILNCLLLGNAWFLVLGGASLWVGFVLTLGLSTFVDEAAGDDTGRTEGVSAVFLNSMLFLSLPLLALNAVLLATLAGGGDLGGIVQGLEAISAGYPSARDATGPWDLLGGILTLGLFTGAAGTNVAHELVHRTGHRPSMLVGRWLLAFSCDTTFSIEHVYGHHRHVATSLDPATARRGEYVLAFAVRSLVDGNRSAIAIEAARLRRKGLAFWSTHNQVLTGQLMSGLVFVMYGYLAGFVGLFLFFAVAVQGKLYLELVNYIEHYGLVRVPGGRVEPRHSWNCNRGISNSLLYNLPRHAHHHMFATKPFWTLESEPDGPRMPHGYLTMMVMSLVPPLWNRKMDPLLRHWDQTMATGEERALLAKQAEAGRIASP
jgi:Fatty acid desaturase